MGYEKAGNMAGLCRISLEELHTSIKDFVRDEDQGIAIEAFKGVEKEVFMFVDSSLTDFPLLLYVGKKWSQKFNRFFRGWEPNEEKGAYKILFCPQEVEMLTFIEIWQLKRTGKYKCFVE